MTAGWRGSSFKVSPDVKQCGADDSCFRDFKIVKATATVSFFLSFLFCFNNFLLLFDFAILVNSYEFGV